MNAAKQVSVYEPIKTSASTRLAAVVLLATMPMAFAGPGDLDTSFGEGGRVFIDVPGDADFAATLVLQADGKLVVGRWNEAIDDDFSVLRLNADGSLDETFDFDARTSLDFPGIKGKTNVVLQQADGKIVAAGTSSHTLGTDGTDFGLARYNTDGSVDTGFGVGGVVIHDLGSQNDSINAIVQQSDGRLVAAGYTYGSDGGNRNMAFVRFNTDGTLDMSFGANGSTVIDFYDGNGRNTVRWLTEQADGKLVATGTVYRSGVISRTDIGVVRLSADGVPDPRFDGDGRVVVELSGEVGGYIAAAHSIALQQDGRIIVAATTNSTVWDYDDCLPWLARLNADGTLDMTFGDRGSVPMSFSSCGGLHGLTIASNGDYYLTGGTDYENRDHFVARVTPTGDLDGSYGVGGVAIVDIGRGNNVADTWPGNQGIVLQPDGKVVTAVSTSVGDRESNDARLVVSRLLANGNSPGLLGFKASPPVSEPSGTAEIFVRRTGGSSGAVSVDYETSGIDATSGGDFTGAGGTLAWADGDITDKSILISITDDTDIEGPESFGLSLSNVSGGASLATSELTIRIQDDEAAPPEAPPTGTSPGDSSGGALGYEVLIILALLLLLGSSQSRIQPRRSPSQS